MTIIIKYVLTLIAAGVLGISAQGEAKSHKEKFAKHEKKSRKHHKKHEKRAEIAPEPVISSEPVKIPEPEVIAPIAPGPVHVPIGKGHHPQD